MEAKTPEKKTVRKASTKPAATKRTTVKKVVVKSEPPKGEFLKTLGRRKEASAQVRLFPDGTGVMTVNDKPLAVYFPLRDSQEAILSPIKLAGREGRVDVQAKVRGGGSRGQADAVRLGVSRALLALDETLRTTLRKAGYLTRDARVKERKKYGLKRARKAPQWAKR